LGTGFDRDFIEPVENGDDVAMENHRPRCSKAQSMTGVELSRHPFKQGFALLRPACQAEHFAERGLSINAGLSKDPAQKDERERGLTASGRTDNNKLLMRPLVCFEEGHLGVTVEP
jgi:hypothetical protein